MTRREETFNVWYIANYLQGLRMSWKGWISTDITAKKPWKATITKTSAKSWRD